MYNPRVDTEESLPVFIIPGEKFGAADAILNHTAVALLAFFRFLDTLEEFFDTHCIKYFS